MKNLINKQKIVIISILAVILILIILLIVFLNSSSENKKNSSEVNTAVMSNEITEDKKSSNKAKELTPEMQELKSKIEQDEAGYGDDYKTFDYCKNTYKRKPDRIYFKDPDKNGFFVFEKDDEDFDHLLEVTEDRMAYTVMEDYNLYSFTPDSINTMMTSKDTYIIFDYDNDNLSEFDENYNKDIIFRFNQNTRLYRLVSYLSYFKELISREDLDKEEFADNTSITGYKYMMYGNFMD